VRFRSINHEYELVITEIHQDDRAAHPPELSVRSGRDDRMGRTPKRGNAGFCSTGCRRAGLSHALVVRGYAAAHQAV
jgi:hypothetical protein